MALLLCVYCWLWTDWHLLLEFFFVEIEQVNPCWDDNDNNNDESSDNEDINGTDFTMNLILFFVNWEPGAQEPRAWDLCIEYFFQHVFQIFLILHLNYFVAMSIVKYSNLLRIAKIAAQRHTLALCENTFFLVRIFPHSDWIRTKKTSYLDTFHTV